MHDKGNDSKRTGSAACLCSHKDIVHGSVSANLLDAKSLCQVRLQHSFYAASPVLSLEATLIIESAGDGFGLPSPGESVDVTQEISARIRIQHTAES